MNQVWTIYCVKSIFNGLIEFNNLLEIIQNYTPIKIRKITT